MRGFSGVPAAQRCSHREVPYDLDQQSLNAKAKRCYKSAGATISVFVGKETGILKAVEAASSTIIANGCGDTFSSCATASANGAIRIVVAQRTRGAERTPFDNTPFKLPPAADPFASITPQRADYSRFHAEYASVHVAYPSL